MVSSEILVLSLGLGLVPARSFDGRLELVRNKDLRGATKVGESCHVRMEEVLRALRPDCLRKGMRGRAENGNEKLDLDALAGARILNRRSGTRKVDEDLLPGPMHLAHRQSTVFQPSSIAFAKLSIFVSVRMGLQVLQMKQLQSDTALLTLLMQPKTIWLGPGGVTQVSLPVEAQV
ncbi:MAG TPA: hypothetical protein RMG48_05060 [Myxococcales bacterium LLY-WYZ-16_1]|nr:hypothetical protein [Myxococcales bacterium LLY-WYZ-16_1]